MFWEMGMIGIRKMDFEYFEIELMGSSDLVFNH